MSSPGSAGNTGDYLIPLAPISPENYFDSHNHELQQYRVTLPYSTGPLRGGQAHDFLAIPTTTYSDVRVWWPAPEDLPAGRYRVTAFIPHQHATTRAATYYVHGALASPDSPIACVVDQGAFGAAWGVLGLFDFDPARQWPVYVDAQNYSTERPPREIAFDLLRFRQAVPPAFGYHALRGIHGPAEPGNGAWTPDALAGVQRLGMSAVKVQISNQDPISTATVERLWQLAGFVMARLAVRFGDLVPGRPPDAYTFFFNEMDGGTRSLLRAHLAGVKYFEVHNEPNLGIEGMYTLWKSGKDFARFFLRLYHELKRRFPNAKFGFPGLSPGPGLPGQRYAAAQFLREAAPAIEEADFLCTHVYWGQHGQTLYSALAELRQFCNQYPDKLVFATEFSNNAPDVPGAVKAQEYHEFYRQLRALPRNLGGAFAYCLTPGGDYDARGRAQPEGRVGRWLEWVRR